MNYVYAILAAEINIVTVLLTTPYKRCVHVWSCTWLVTIGNGKKEPKKVVLTDHVRSLFHSPRTTETDRRLHFPDRTKHVSDYVKE